MTVGGVLFSDPYRKLVALALALALWFYLDNQVSDEHSITLTLEALQPEAERQPDRTKLAVPLPSGRFDIESFRNANTDESIRTIDLQFRGPKSRIQELKRNHQFRVRPRELGELVKSIEIGVEDIEERQEYLDMLVSMDPPRVKVNLEALDEVQVKPDMAQTRWPEGLLTRLGGRLLREQATLVPPIANLEGPRSVLNQASNVEFVFKTERESEDVVIGALMLSDTNSKLRLTQNIRVTIPLEPERHSYPMRIPVLADDGKLPPESRSVWKPTTPTVMTTIEAYGNFERRYLLNGESHDAVATSHLRLVVTLEPDDRDKEEVVREAVLMPIDLDEIDPQQYRLASGVAVTIRRKQESTADPAKEDGAPPPSNGR